MKPYIAENPEKTRRAVVNGRKVQFFRRRPSVEQKTNLYPWWHDTYPDKDAAKEAADFYARTGNLKWPRAKPKEERIGI